jgi:Na+/melibiose symporter-like transporter
MLVMMCISGIDKKRKKKNLRRKVEMLSIFFSMASVLVMVFSFFSTWDQCYDSKVISPKSLAQKYCQFMQKIDHNKP